MFLGALASKGGLSGETIDQFNARYLHGAYTTDYFGLCADVSLAAIPELTIFVHQCVLVDALLDPARGHDVLALRSEISYKTSARSSQRRRLAHNRHVTRRILVIHDDVRRVHKVGHDATAVLSQEAGDLIEAVIVS